MNANTENGQCDHANMRRPEFDRKRADSLDSWHDVRMEFPRYQGTCPDCGEFLTVYASLEHKEAGNW